MTSKSLKNKINFVKENLSVPRVLFDMQVWNGRGNRIACPIHGGENPNNFEFSRDWWRCYSECNSGGDVINLVEKYAKVSIFEAMKILDEEYHLGVFTRITKAQYLVNRRENEEFEAFVKSQRNNILEQCEETPINTNRVSDYRKERIKSDYLLKRGVSQKVIDYFEIFYSYDPQKGKVVNFPLKNKSGELIGISERSIITKAYYFPKNTPKILYGNFEIRNALKVKRQEKAGEIWVVEGTVDCLTLWSWGKYAVALNGLGNDNMMLELRELPTDTLILALDNDIAGQKASEKLLEYLADSDKNIKKFDWKDSNKKDINELSKEEFEILINKEGD